MKVTLDRDEFWPYLYETKYNGVVFEIPKKLWESYKAAQTAFEAEHAKLNTCIERQGRTAQF